MMSLSLLFCPYWLHVSESIAGLHCYCGIGRGRGGEGVEKGNNREILHSNVQCVEKGNNSVEQTREFREDSSAMEPRGEAQGAQVNNYVIIRGARRVTERVTECALQCVGDNLGGETRHSGDDLGKGTCCRGAHW